MNKFLSRGKRKDNGEWIIGYYVKIPNKVDKLNKWCHIIFDLDGNAEYIIPETAGRCSETTDKNGVLVSEGDIVEFYFFDKTRRNGELVDVKNIRTMLIEWRKDSFYMRELFRNYHLDKELNVVTEVIYDHRGDKEKGVYRSNSAYFVEIVGNIHDNPELIGGTE